MNDILTAMVITVPITTALTEAVKRAIPANVDRFAPVIAILSGVGAAFLFPPSMAPMSEFAAGVLSGLAASGLYSGYKATAMGR